MSVCRFFLLFLACAALQPVLPARAQSVSDPWQACLRPMDQAEREYRIEPGLLRAVMLAESGRNNPGTGELTPWPWTINVDGQGYYYDTRDEAVAAANRFLAEGARFVDVGCMQINLQYHPGVFASMEEAFDPVANVTYGAQFLREQYVKHREWNLAVQYYHGGADERRLGYLSRVMRFWRGGAARVADDGPTIAEEELVDPYIIAADTYEAGNYNTAKILYEGLSANRPDSRLAWLGLAMSSARLGETAEARKAYETLVSLEPDNREAVYRLIDLVRRLDLRAQISELERLSKKFPGAAQLPAALSEILAETGSPEAALRYARQAAGLDPESADYALNAAILADRLGQKRVALAYYERFLETFSDNPVAVVAGLDRVRARTRFLRDAVARAP